MASSCNVSRRPSYSSSTLVVYSVSLVFLLMISVNKAAAATNIDASNATAKVCADTKNPPLCIEILNNDQRTASGADVLLIATVTTNLSQINATDTQNYITTLLKSVTAPSAQIIHLKTCSLSFEIVVPNLNLIANILQSGGDYKRAHQLATDAMSHVADCENGFSSPPAIQSPLTDRNNNLGSLVDIVISATNLLSPFT
ncbi:Pectinesterase inhibitor domain [Macleaya cordata]|uniref:Pectinesterase inhibitor domain n=1 Tax=Macleaya cordata TaxID=56857 RepID=A0A200R1W6_MACCD|nr:Pectinesterase inhibitor domain [Macleaya cordata]